MRRFIHAITIAGALIPAVASAQSTGDNGTSGGSDTTQGAGTSTGGADSAAPATTTGATEQAATPAAATGNNTLSDRGTSSTTASSTTPAPLPFRGSTLILDQSVSGDTLAPSGVLSPVPSYQWWISFRPRWQLTDFLSFRGRADLTMEWLNGADTTLYHQPQWGDIWTDLVLNNLPAFQGIKPSLGVRAIWGTSLESQYRTMIVTPYLTAGLSRAFNDPAGGKLTLGLGLAGGHPLYEEANGRTRTPYPGRCVATANSIEAGTCQTLGGSENVEWTAQAYATLGYDTPIKGLSVNLFYLLVNQWRYQTPDTTIHDQTGGDYTVPRSDTDTRQRTYGWWLASIDYEVTKWASASLGYYVYRLALDENGSYGNPLWSLSSSAVTRVFFSLTLNLDEVYDAVTGRTEQPVNNPISNTNRTSASNGSGWSINQAAREMRAQQVLSGFAF